MALLTTEQAALALGYPSPEALMKAAQRGTFPAGVHKVGRRWRFDVDTILRLTEWDPDRGRVVTGRTSRNLALAMGRPAR